MVTVDLRHKLQDERCAGGGDVKAHLDKLRTIRADLIAMGADPGDDNFIAIVLGSLPMSYKTYLSALTGAAALLGKPLDPDTVLQGISDEADRKGARHTSKGAYGKDRWAKGGGKEGQNPHRKGHGHENTAKTEQNLDAAWIAVAQALEDDVELDELDEEELEWDSDDKYADMPTLQSVPNSDDEADDTEDDVPAQRTSHTSKDLVAMIITTAPENALEIYDSGTTQHMTPSRHRLINYKAIEPRGIVAADNKSFIPNGENKSTKVLVRDVLYAPNLGVTLISIARIAHAGYAVQFRQKECRIFDAKNHRIGTIPLVRGLYSVAVTDATPRANVASDGPLVATPEELHRLMGHLPIESAKKLVKINWWMESNWTKLHRPPPMNASHVCTAE
ncbi:CCHC-type domain-containing protein [Mycena venus]|uniref:CCHC-type domain-containing protein n=1 Tax=Mycena venus TaxID=2733690 RepID=A0A8H6ZA21_9AGAR|nr:CCHC-type domain-containing protein [Mycena venus]